MMLRLHPAQSLLQIRRQHTAVKKVVQLRSQAASRPCLQCTQQWRRQLWIRRLGGRLSRCKMQMHHQVHLVMPWSSRLRLLQMCWCAKHVLLIAVVGSGWKQMQCQLGDP